MYRSSGFRDGSYWIQGRVFFTVLVPCEVVLRKEKSESCVLVLFWLYFASLIVAIGHGT